MLQSVCSPHAKQNYSVAGRDIHASPVLQIVQTKMRLEYLGYGRCHLGLLATIAVAPGSRGIMDHILHEELI